MSVEELPITKRLILISFHIHNAKSRLVYTADVNRVERVGIDHRDAFDRGQRLIPHILRLYGTTAGAPGETALHISVKRDFRYVHNYDL